MVLLGGGGGEGMAGCFDFCFILDFVLVGILFWLGFCFGFFVSVVFNVLFWSGLLMFLGFFHEISELNWYIVGFSKH